MSRDRHFNLYRFRIFNLHLDLSRNEISWKRGRIENYEKNSIILFPNGFLAEISVHHDMDLKYPVAGGRVWQKEQSQPNPDRIAMVWRCRNRCKKICDAIKINIFDFQKLYLYDWPSGPCLARWSQGGAFKKVQEFIVAFQEWNIMLSEWYCTLFPPRHEKCTVGIKSSTHHQINLGT